MASGRETIRDHAVEAYLLKGRLKLTAVATLVAVAVLLVRLVDLQILKQSHFETLSNNNRIRLLAVPPTRGLIYDRNGVILAHNLPTYGLQIVPEAVPDLPDTVARLAQLLTVSTEDRERFEQALQHSRSFEGISLRTNLSDSEVARFAVHRHEFPGVEIVAGLRRSYPLGASGAHVIGYVARIDENDLAMIDRRDYRGTSHIGKTGVEKHFESRLHGQVGFRQVEVNVAGRELRVLDAQPAKPGEDLYLTIDAELQAVAERVMGEYSGAIVMLDIATGEVLAMASQPSFDPNLFALGISNKQYQVLKAAPTRPLFNRALAGQYPPGSTLKPFLGLAALETGVQNATNSVLCRGYFMLPNYDRRYRDWRKEGHGRVNMNSAIAQSCDVYFYDLALRLGIDRIAPYLKGFGFGARTGIDTVGEATGVMPSRSWKRDTKNQPWFPGDTLNTGLGQGGVTATPLQLAHASAALFADGHRVQPRLALAMANADGAPLNFEIAKLPAVRVREPQHWEEVKASMRNVVAAPQGTAYWVHRGARVKIAGKTGTAQVIGIGQDEEYDAAELAHHLRDHSLFIAAAPSDNPSVVVAVVVEHGGSGGRVAAPMARRLIEFTFEAGGERIAIQ